ncbi:MAG: NAD+ synthase [bacterium]
MAETTDQLVRICLAQINPVVGDIKRNADKIISSINLAESCNADIVVFPELSLSGYPPEDLLFKSSFLAQVNTQLKRIVRASNSIVSIVGYPHRREGKLFNSAAVISRQSIRYNYHKIHLPNFGVFDEKRYFYSGSEYPVITLGNAGRFGLNICRDIWEDAGMQVYRLRAGFVDAIINISSSPFQVGKHNDRTKLIARRARQTCAYVLYCNLVGGQDELVFDGGSFAVNPQGKVIARGKQFEEDFMVTDIPVRTGNRPHKGKQKTPLGFHTVHIPHVLTQRASAVPLRIDAYMSRWEEVYSALVLGLRDYVQKNKFTKVVIGLSGGIDSSLTAAIAVDALGCDNVIGLTMPSVYSSDAAREDAQVLAQNLQISFKKISIQTIYNTYLTFLKKHFKGHQVNTAEENIQARIRGNILMAFSNKFNWLVLTTGNKSEISVGYCTLYGDTAGGFAVLKDIPKTWVYKLTEWQNKQYASPRIPISIVKRPPTAELKPNQRDQDSLPPYNILDSLIEQYVEKRRDIASIRLNGCSLKRIKHIIDLIDAAEYKRRQSPPGIKITPLAFGKDRRMPITHK